MAKVFDDGSGFFIECPACGCHHKFDKGRWTFNGDVNKPTFAPSMLVRGHLGEKNGIDIYGTCHSFVTDGKIQFLNDCTHDLRGQTVELPEAFGS